MKLFAAIPAETRRTWLSKDAIAGLTVWAVLIPEALAYTTIVWMPPLVDAAPESRATTS